MWRYFLKSEKGSLLGKFYEVGTGTVIRCRFFLTIEIFDNRHNYMVLKGFEYPILKFDFVKINIFST